MTDLTGKLIRGYELRGKVGEGGFGAVYKASQKVIGRDVAIKIIHSEYSNQPEFVRRFEAEAQLIARLEHIHIVPLYDYWRDPDGAYLVMRWLSGGSVRQSLRNGPWQLGRVIDLLNQLVPALQVAHRRGIIHRDIKPENILIDNNNNFFLTDFGIAIDMLDTSSVTLENIVFGSPAYISPEQITNRLVSPMADVYGLGILTYELLTGSLPFNEPTQTEVLKRHVYAPVPSIKEKRPDLSRQLDVIIWRATAKNPDARFTDVTELVSAIEGVAADADPLREKLQAKSDSGELVDSDTVVLGVIVKDAEEELRNPYKGLRAFEESDADDFFGRDDLVNRLLERMNETPLSRFLAVVGPSGSGKSSLVKAGLIPMLRRNEIPGSEKWFIAAMTPGAQPFQGLAEALLRIGIKDPGDLFPISPDDETGILRIMSAILPDDTELLLFIDQFEEIFTLSDDDELRFKFLQMLHYAVTAPESRLRVIITLRADFFDRPLLYPSFGNLVREHTEVVLPLTLAELEQAISGPAIRGGLLVESGLSTTIAHDVSQQPGALPLLQYALTELFEQNEDFLLTSQMYERIGGITGALVSRAEDIFDTLNPDEKKQTRQIFLRLVTLEQQGGEPTRRRVLWENIVSVDSDRECIQYVLDLFGQYRLLTFDRDPFTRAPTVEVAHETLIRNWARLNDWVEESRNQLHIQRQLAVATAEWLQFDKEASFLVSGARLAQFETLLPQKQLALTEHERDYIEYSIALREKATRRMRLIAITLAVFSILTLVFALVAMDGQSRAEDARTAAIDERDRANQEADIAHSRELAAAVLANLDQPDLALLLGNMAVEFADTFEARSSLLTALQSNTYLSFYLHGHENAVRCVAFSPDGKTLVSGDRDNILILWNIETHQAIGQPLKGHTDAINSVAFSHDGRFIASGSADGTIRIWDAVTGDYIRELVMHTDAVWSVVFSPHGSLLVSGSADETIILWDFETGQMIGEPLTGHTDAVYSVAFSPDGNLVASAGADQMVRLWDVDTGEAVGDPLIGHTNWVFTVVFSPDGQLLATGGVEPDILFWSVSTGQLLGQISTGDAGWTREIAFNANGQIIVTANTDHLIRLWEVSSGKMVGQPLKGHVNEVWSVAFNPTELSLATGGADGHVLIWDFSALQPLSQMRLTSSDEIAAVAVSSDGLLIATASGGGDMEADATGAVRIWGSQSGELIHTLEGHAGPVIDVAFSPDGEYLISAGGDATLVLWDVKTGEMVGSRWFGHTAPVRQVLFMADNQTVVSGGDDERILFWNISTGLSEERSPIGQSGGILSLALSPDGRQLAMGGREGVIFIWDITVDAPPAQLTGHTDAITDLAFSEDGSVLVSSSRDASIIVWNIKSGESVGQPLVGHQDWILSIALSPDGNILASGGRDHTIILWDMDSGRPIGVPLSGHFHWVNDLVFNPGGDSLISGSRDGAIIIWAMDLSQWQQLADQIANRELTNSERLQFLGSDSPD